MPINSDHLKNNIIIPTLNFISLNSKSAVNLGLGTAAKESHLGTYLVQLEGGPARGIHQMEMFTNDDIRENVLKYHPVLKERVDALLINGLSYEQNLIGNFYYATAMMRVQYWREPTPLPDADDIRGLAYYWDRYYNKNPEKGTPDEFINCYNIYVK